MSKLVDRVTQAILNGPNDDPQACAEAAIRIMLDALAKWPAPGMPDPSLQFDPDELPAWGWVRGLEAFKAHHRLR